jgi:hypothetical protein
VDADGGATAPSPATRGWSLHTGCSDQRLTFGSRSGYVRFVTAPRITNPGQTLERCYERRQAALANAEYAESQGWPASAAACRRRAAALQGTITRISRQYLGVTP